MADVQLENGYVRVATALLEAVAKVRLTGVEASLILWLIRESFGWNRREAPFSLRKIAKDCGRDRAGVRAALRALEQRGMVKTAGGSLHLIKDFDTWTPPGTTAPGDCGPRGLQPSNPGTTAPGIPIAQTYRHLSAFGPEDLVKLWNDTAAPELPRVLKLTSDRRRRLTARLKENSDRDYWVKVIATMNISDFCKGKSAGSQGWVADLDWLIKPDSAIRILEGKYADRKPAKIEAAPIFTTEAARANTVALLKLRREQDAAAEAQQ